MNSYQTLNAAAAAAGISKQSAVRFGRAWEEGQRYNGPAPRLQPLGAPNIRPLSIGRILFDIETTPSRTSGFKSAGFADRVAADKARNRSVGNWNAEDKARQLRGRDAGIAVGPHGEHIQKFFPRDQSEDRQPDRLQIVAVANPSGLDEGVYWAYYDRWNSVRISVWFRTQQEAIEKEESFRKEFGGRLFSPAAEGPWVYGVNAW